VRATSTQKKLKKEFMQLNNKTIVITGACGLIGREFVKACLGEGARVILADKSGEAGIKFVEELNNSSAHFVQADITSESSVDHLIAEAEKKFGQLHALVNNAYPRNAAYGNKLEEVSTESFNENVNLHLGGYFLCMKKFAAYFKNKGGGNVVNMGSIYGVVAPRFEIYEESGMTMPVEYAAIKAAIIHLTRYFAAYYKKDNIRFNCISPGGIFNNQAEAFVAKYSRYAPMLQKNELNSTLIYLLSDESKNKTAENIIVDKGWSQASIH
jgi:NAD(P)-dependent dehydrogenase (short-subunit alcohol dehydrogenase family)